MVRLFDRETASEVGTITEDQLDFLIAHLEEEIIKFSGIQFDPECVKHLEQAYAKGFIYEELPNTTPTIYELIEQI